jgi:dTMP kinase
MKSRGQFIVFEGIDGCGKTTTCEKIKESMEWLELYPTRTIYTETEPTEHPIGNLFHKIMTGEDVFDMDIAAGLIMMDRYDHIVNPEYGMRKKVEDGGIVLASRYVYSTLAYNQTENNALYLRYLRNKYYQLLKPDMTIFLDISPEEAVRRISKRDAKPEIFEKVETLRKFRQNFLNLFINYGEIDNIYIYDAEGQTPEEVVNGIMPYISRLT